MTEPPTRSTNLFGSPLMAHRWADGAALNDQLRPLILAQAARAPTVAKTNIGGWHSAYGKLEFCGEAGETLVRHMHAMADEATARVLKDYGHAPRTFDWRLDAWANVNRAGDFNQMHTHPGSTWSGVYYVDTGVDAAAEAAPLHIFDPCQGRANTFLPGLAPSSFTVRPVAGEMVIFPSYLAHMVFPHQGPRPRISIAFNMRRDPFP